MISPQRLALPSLISCYSLDILDRHLLNQRSLVYAFYFCHPKSPPFSTSRLITLKGISCVSSPLLSSPLPSPVPRFPSRGSMRRSRWGIGSCGCGCWLPVGVTVSHAFLRPTIKLLRDTSEISCACCQLYPLLILSVVSWPQEMPGEANPSPPPQHCSQSLNNNQTRSVPSCY